MLDELIARASRVFNVIAIGCTGIITVVFVVGIFVFVDYMVTPEGEAVGSVPADDRAQVSVTSAAGDSLVFVLTYSFPILPFGVFDGPARDNAITRALRSSRLGVSATAASGEISRADCAAYNGRNETTTEVGGTRTLSGALTDCVIALPSPGTYRVSGRVAWAPELHGNTATLEVRRKAADAR